MTRQSKWNASLASLILAVAVTGSQAAAKDKDIVETAVGAGSFQTLTAALKAADLVDVLKGDGPFTVFAPTDEAFAKLPKGTVETLLKPENKAKLTAILKYHVVQGRVYSADALAAGQAKTLQGDTVKISVHDKAAMVNGAKLVTTDLDTRNGVIHVIDSVLLPPEKQSAAASRKMIESAIAKGAPLYNAGQHEQSAQVYMQTAKHLLASGHHRTCASTNRTLRTALHTSKRTNCATTQAWTMRRALDLAYRSVR